MFKSKPIKPISSSSSSSFPCCKKKKFIFLMASFLFLITLFSSILFFSLSSAFHHHHHNQNQNQNHPHSNQTPSPEIHQACKSTRYPEICETSLLQSPNLPKSNPTPIEIIQSSISITTQNLKTAQSMVFTILNSSSSSSNPNRLTAAKNCVEALHNSEYRLSSSTTEISPRGRIKYVRAWMSASLLYQYDCWSALKYVNDSQLVNETMSFINSLIGLTSNSLSMVVSYDLFGDETASWKPPQTERDGFWENNNSDIDLKKEEFKGGFPLDLTVDVTVCKDEKEKCSYKKIQDAVDAAPERVKRFVIRIGEGVYEETVRVPLEKTNLVFIGEGMGKTVITGSLNADTPGISTYNTATVGVLGDGFMARDLTFENTAGPIAHQAVAFRSGSDLSVIENCEFLGNQDTLYAHSLRQFYKSCRIEGNVDFIFGNSASVFQDCIISIRQRQVSPEKGEKNAVTAHGRTDPAQSTGFVFRNCVINGTDAYMKFYYQKPKVHKNYLGRPWKEYSRTVFIHCLMGELITAEGWLPWSGDFALSTLYYGEFENSGQGANVSSRVAWSSQIPAKHVCGYSVQSFIQGNEWIPDGSS